MAFCKFCGAKLEDGEICKCQQQSAATAATAAAANEQQTVNTTQPAQPQQFQQPQQPQYQQPQYQQYQQPQYQQQYQPQYQQQYQPQYQQQYKPAGPNYFSVFFGWVKKCFKNPATASREIVAKGSFKPAFILLGIYAVCVCLLVMTVSIKLNKFLSPLTDLLNIFSSKTHSGFINIVAITFISLFGAYAVAMAFACLLLLFNFAFKGKLAFKNAMAAAGIRYIIKAPFVLLTVLIAAVIPGSTFISIFPIIIISFFLLTGEFASIFVTEESIKDGGFITDNKAVYIAALSFIAKFIVVAIVCAIITACCINLPQAISSSTYNTMSGLSGLLS